MNDRIDKLLTRQTGFTLVELLIVVAIIGILASISTAYFGDSAIASKRTDGRAVLLDTAGALEKCKAIYGSYNNINCNITNGSSIDSSEKLYSVKVTSNSTTYSLTATPLKSQANDSDCTSIILDNFGKQTGTGADPSSCW